MLEVNRCSSVEWKPSPIVALATSPDCTQVAASRADGSLEIWLVPPGSLTWHCQLTIHGKSESRVSSLVWCRSGSRGAPSSRLLSTSLDGSVYEWDIFDLSQKMVLDSIGVALWQMAAEPRNSPVPKQSSGHCGNDHFNDAMNNQSEEDSSDSEVDNDTAEHCLETVTEDTRLAIACDDGSVQIYCLPDEDKLTYIRSLPRVSGRMLSVTWSPDAKRIYSGSSDGLMRCWDAKLGHEVYRITVGLGGLGSGSELCIWSLLALRNGTLVSGDSTGSVQFWDSHHGTLLNAHSCHRGDVNALAAAPSHNSVFAADSDGQVILYKLSCNPARSENGKFSSDIMKKWVYVCNVKAHTHDVRALAIVIPISWKDFLPSEKLRMARVREKPRDFSYHKWARLGVAMLISAGDDSKLFAYSVKEFTKFTPHDICPAPQPVPMQLVINTDFDQTPLLLIQSSRQLDICIVRIKNSAVPENGSGGPITTNLMPITKCRAPRKILCSTISSSGMFFAYSDHVKPKLFELRRSKASKSAWTIDKRQLPVKLPCAHSMIFSSDSSKLLIAGQDRRIYVVNVGSSELVHVFTPCQKDHGKELPPTEPAITRMFTSNDGRWLAAVNCFGDVYIFNLEIQRQHWFISRLDDASVTAGGFTPQKGNMLLISTSCNQVYAFDVEARQLGEWSMRHTFSLPRRYQEFPGEVIGLSFPPSSSSSSVIVYSPRAICSIDLGVPVEGDNDTTTAKLKRKLKHCDLETKHNGRKNYEFCAFRDPVLFVGHVSRNSLLIIDKPWMRVAESFDAKPVHRHLYGM